MPYYRLVDQETRKSISVRRMSHEIATIYSLCSVYYPNIR